MKGFKVKLKDFKEYPNGDKEDVMITNDKEALENLGGYLRLGADGTVKIVDPKGEKGLGTFNLPYPHEIIRK